MGKSCMICKETDNLLYFDEFTNYVCRIPSPCFNKLMTFPINIEVNGIQEPESERILEIMRNSRNEMQGM